MGGTGDDGYSDALYGVPAPGGVTFHRLLLPGLPLLPRPGRALAGAQTE